jgi:hypothetical protein
VSDGESFSNSIYVNQAQLAERELSAFIHSVTELFGPEQARFSTEDWIEEAELSDSPPVSTERDWRSVTIAASARLASRINAAQYHQKSLQATTDVKVSPILLSNCFAFTLLM